MATINQIWIHKRIIQTDQISFIRYFLAFRITQVPLASFPEMYKMWSFQNNFLSMITPRNLVLLVSLIISSSMLIFKLGWGLFLLENIMKCVFMIFKDILFAFNHKENSFNSVFRVFKIKSASLPLINKLLPSANNIGNVYWQTEARWFIYNRNNREPRIDPCGTPHLINWLWDLTPL